MPLIPELTIIVFILATPHNNYSAIRRVEREGGREREESCIVIGSTRFAREIKSA